MTRTLNWKYIFLVRFRRYNKPLTDNPSCRCRSWWILWKLYTYTMGFSIERKTLIWKNPSERTHVNVQEDVKYKYVAYNVRLVSLLTRGFVHFWLNWDSWICQMYQRVSSCKISFSVHSKIFLELGKGVHYNMAFVARSI